MHRYQVDAGVADVMTKIDNSKLSMSETYVVNIDTQLGGYAHDLASSNVTHEIQT